MICQASVADCSGISQPNKQAAACTVALPPVLRYRFSHAIARSSRLSTGGDTVRYGTRADYQIVRKLKSLRFVSCEAIDKVCAVHSERSATLLRHLRNQKRSSLMPRGNPARTSKKRGRRAEPIEAVETEKAPARSAKRQPTSRGARSAGTARSQGMEETMPTRRGGRRAGTASVSTTRKKKTTSRTAGSRASTSTGTTRRSTRTGTTPRTRAASSSKTGRTRSTGRSAATTTRTGARSGSRTASSGRATRSKTTARRTASSRS